MGIILNGYKEALLQDVLYDISANISYYYAFAGNPVAFSNNSPPSVSNTSYDQSFTSNWQMLFGKLLSNTNIYPVISNIPWTTNTMYNIYDNQTPNLSNFYVVSQPGGGSSDYYIYVCINNANGVASTVQPDLVQENTFYKSDGYGWRYITTIPYALYANVATSDYIPVVSNTTVVAASANNSGVENVLVTNVGSGYVTYYNGTVQFVNSSIIQIDQGAMNANNFYTNNAIYVYTPLVAGSAQLFTITNYISNSSGNYCVTNNSVNTSPLTAGLSLYSISPAVVFNTDGITDPVAYTSINPTTNSIANVNILNIGSAISWANATVVSNSYYGSGATLQCVVPPPGGYGADPVINLRIQGLSISFTFANTESNTIPTNVLYNRIGVMKNPYKLNANGTKSATPYTNATFSQVLQANISPSVSYTMGDQVMGSTSGALGTIAFANSTVVYLTGDKIFANGETIVSTSTSVSTTITINTLGAIYTKDIRPMYIQNVQNVTRSNTQSESFQLIIEL